MNSSFQARFPKQLAHWTFHVVCGALPSLVIASVLMELWKSPSAVLAMLTALCVFIVAFAVATSLPGPLSNPHHVLSRGIRLGAKVRSSMAALSLPFVVVPPLIWVVPDFWCGLLAVGLQNMAARLMGLEEAAIQFNGGSAARHFLPVFTTTMLEGFIISFLLLMISFFCVIHIQSRDRKRMTGPVAPRPANTASS